MVYPITKFWFYPLNWLMIKRIKGESNIPANSNFIIVSNHEKLIDPLYILYPILKKLNKKVHFLSTGRWWFFGDTICRRWAGCIPLFNAEQAYNEAKELIKSKEIIGIFPEGGTQRTKNPKTGSIRLAIETNVLVLPVGLRSSYFPFTSVLSIGKPIYFKSKKNIKNQAKELMKCIYKLRNSLN